MESYHISEHMLKVSAMWRLIVLLICHNVLAGAGPRVDPLVETKLGLIRGLKSDDGQYSKFLGIPYAVVDEANPFSESSPHNGFNTTFNAYNGSIECPQFTRTNTVTGQIQCLTLNVFVPNSANSNNRLPVMVWIHGGAFVEGSGGEAMFSPKHLIPHDIVFVSINYRLGIYGFMCTDSRKAPGNTGLKDQLSALRWVNEHIESFGGDKNKITIFGESAGGMSVHLQVLSPFEKLFHNAIIQSGPAGSPHTVVNTNNDVALQIAEKLGLVTEDVDAALDFIAKSDFNLAIAAGAELKSPSIAYANEPLTKPCVEKEFEGIERFISENPNKVIPEKVKTVPIIMGYTSQEMNFQHQNQPASFFENYAFGDLLQFGFDMTNFDDEIDSVKHFYIGEGAPSEKLSSEITSFASDFVFNHPTERAINNFIAAEPQAIYYFVFSYNGDLHYGPSINSTSNGVAHGTDLMYLFAMDIVGGDISAADQLTIDRMTKLWTNFAKYGDPTPETSELLPVMWEPVTQHSKPYLDVNKNLTLARRPYHERMAYWDLFYKLNVNHTKWNE